MNDEQDPMQLAEHCEGTAETACAEPRKRCSVTCVAPCYPEHDPNPLRKLKYYSHDRIAAGFTVADDPRGYVALLVMIEYCRHYHLFVWDDANGNYKFVSSILASRQATAEKACVDYLEATL